MNILILSASTGGGHNRASNALKSYISSVDRDSNVEIIDTLKYCSSILDKTVTTGYKVLAKKAPELYGTFYKTADKESPISELVNSAMTQFAKKLLPLLEEKNTDIVVTCHPFASSMMSILKATYDVNVPVVSIITDYMPHRAYIGDHIDAYITASKDTADNLSKKYGVDNRRIYPLGMPIFNSFYEHDEKREKETLDRLGFSHSIPTVLIMAGSFGVTDILKIYEHLVELPVDYQIIVITGKNQKLYDAFEKMLTKDIKEFETHDYSTLFSGLSDANIAKMIYEHSEQLRHELSAKLTKTFRRSTDKTKPTKLFYFVDNVEDYMHISDLIITKPGGLTTSESLACALPMAVFKAFPGQEAQNADFLVDKKAAIVLEKGEKGAKQIEELLTHPEILREMKENCRNCAQVHSTERIFSLLNDIIKTQNNIN
ncbi:MAG: galactosyldiacylglycerol synthase [Ruminococcus sp.]|nr:galactosyldiacylglycerol synthase [Ruminococcus sp.]MBQ7134579.1 galactosyldiacylglycerol synthase [Ruminococcus sp.]